MAKDEDQENGGPIEVEPKKSGPVAHQAKSGASLSPKVLELLVCPLTKTALKYDKDRQELLSDAARLAYPIRDGVPIMLPSEARVLSMDEVKKKGKGAAHHLLRKSSTQ